MPSNACYLVTKWMVCWRGKWQQQVNICQSSSSRYRGGHHGFCHIGRKVVMTQSELMEEENSFFFLHDPMKAEDSHSLWLLEVSLLSWRDKISHKRGRKHPPLVQGNKIGKVNCSNTGELGQSLSFLNDQQDSYCFVGQNRELFIREIRIYFLSVSSKICFFALAFPQKFILLEIHHLKNTRHLLGLGESV